MTAYLTKRVRHTTVSPLPLMLGVLALALWVFAVHEADYAHMTSYGLVSIIRWPFFLGLAIVIVGLTRELLRDELETGFLIFFIVILIIFMFGTACAVEPTSSLYDSWLHAGFTQYIVQHGHSLNDFDARFSWPGGFSLAAVLVSFAGQANALGFIRWFPLFIELMYLAPLLTIARFCGVDRRTGWLGVALYYATNWIYQDYFSPQALNYLFFLVVVATILAWWQPRRYIRAPWLGTSLHERISQTLASLRWSRINGNDAVSAWTSSVNLTVFVLLALIVLASSMSHQLTPYALIMALGALLLTRRLGRPELVVIAGLFAVGWLSLGASNYWLGHLSAIFGSVGQLSSTLGSNVTSRITGNVSHRIVVDARILDVAALYFLAAIGVLRRAATSRALELLTIVPFFLIAAQDYGGEGLLRVVLFGLPFVALLASSALLPSTAGSIRPLVPNRWFGPLGRPPKWILTVVVVCVLFAFSVATFVVRGGNDAFESFSKGELLAVRYVYHHAHSGQAIWLAAPFLPIEYENVNTMPVEIAAYQAQAPTIKYVLYTLISNNAKWIILSKSEGAWGTDVAGYPPGWLRPFTRSLEKSGFTIVARWPTATVLHYKG